MASLKVLLDKSVFRYILFFGYMMNNKGKTTQLKTGAALITFFICCASFVYAQENLYPGAGPDIGITASSSEFKKEARASRAEGLRLQKLGDFEGALNLFQKAIDLDPSYALAYNDLGIVYETLGFLDSAEAGYQEAIRITPELTSPYANLALLYENKGELNKAASYWSKRAALGSQDDPWRKKAEDRLSELSRVDPELKEKYIELETARLMNKIAEEKMAKKFNDRKWAKEYYLSAKNLYNSREYPKALQEAEKSLSLDPGNSEAIKLRDNLKLLIKKDEITGHYQLAKKHHSNKEYSLALEEAEKALSLDAKSSEMIRFRDELKELLKKQEIEAHYLAAKKHHDSQEFDKALEEMKKVLSLDPNNSEMLKFNDELKLLLEKKKMQEKADKLRGIFNSGLKEYQQGNYEAAKKEFERIIESALPARNK